MVKHCQRFSHITLPLDIKLKRWDEAVADCNAVLKAEPQNMKGKQIIKCRELAAEMPAVIF